jgi:hypothetical protein
MQNGTINDINARSAEINDLLSQLDTWRKGVSFPDTTIILWGVGGARMNAAVNQDCFNDFKSISVTNLQDQINEKVTDFNTEYPDVAYVNLDNVTGFAAVAHETMRQVTLTWDAVTDATAYRIFKQLAPSGDIDFTRSLLITTIEAVGYVDFDVLPDTAYNYFILATAPDKLDSETPAADSITTPEWDA